MKPLLLLLLLGWVVYREIHPNTVAWHEGGNTFTFSTLDSVTVTDNTAITKHFDIPCEGLGSRIYQTESTGIGCWDAEKQAFVWYQLEDQ